MDAGRGLGGRSAFDEQYEQARAGSAAHEDWAQVRSWANFSLFFYSCIPTGLHGPTCIFWANLTPFALQHGGESGTFAGGVRGDHPSWGAADRYGSDSGYASSDGRHPQYHPAWGADDGHGGDSGYARTQHGSDSGYASADGRRPRWDQDFTEHLGGWHAPARPLPEVNRPDGPQLQSPRQPQSPQSPQVRKTPRWPRNWANFSLL